MRCAGLKYWVEVRDLPLWLASWCRNTDVDCFHIACRPCLLNKVRTSSYGLDDNVNLAWISCLLVPRQRWCPNHEMFFRD